MCGVYPAADAKTAGDQISSTGEGRHLTFLESELFHPYHADGKVDKGDPVVAQTSTGYIVGVAFESALTANDLIAIDTEGIWALKVYANKDELWATSQTGAVTPGDPLFIDRVTTGAITAGVGACGISKRRDRATQVPFGFALGSLADEDDGVIAVKIHNQGSFDLIASMCNRNVAKEAMGWGFFGRQTSGQSEGLAGYMDGTILGTPTGPTYNFGSWVCINAAAVMGANLAVPYEGGIIAEVGASIASSELVYGAFYQAPLNAGNPGSLHVWKLNASRTVTALINAVNPGSVGFTAGAETADYVGSIPFVTVSGAVRWIRLYDAAS